MDFIPKRRLWNFMSQINFMIHESYIKSKGELKEFQVSMQQFSNGKKEVCILSAPTGSGKTYGFKTLIEDNKFILILLPNNLLAREVTEDFLKSGATTVLLTSSTVTEELEKMKKDGFQSNRDRAILSIISGKRIVITNPELFYYIILNKYKLNKKADALTDFILNGLKMIVIDEVHVYSRDQMNILLAIMKLFHTGIKILFSSATIPEFLKTGIKNLFGEDNVEEIKVNREYEKNSTNSILQGKINVFMPEFNSTASFLEKNIDILSSGYWFIIGDSIRNMKLIYDVVKQYFPTCEIGLISAYHDPEYKTYQEIFKNSKYRIIIGSNIIEQGINPPKYFSNFIMEPGFDIKNFVQRVGRIGRNSEKVNNLYVIFKSENIARQEFYDGMTIEKFYEIMEKKLPESKIGYKPGYIGIYSALIVNYLSHNLAETILTNINIDRDAFGYTQNFNRTKKTLDLINRIKNNKEVFYEFKREIRGLKSILEWWDLYYNSIINFIPASEKVTGFDIDEKHKFNYDYIWILKNKNVGYEENNVIIVNGFNEKVTYDFDVNVYGIPFNKFTLKYKDIDPYRARKFIIKNIKEDNGMQSSSDKAKILSEGLKDIVIATADYSRLKLEVI